MLLIPLGQNLYINGFHLYMYRILVLIGWTRWAFKLSSPGQFLPGGFNLLDKLFLAGTIYRAIATVLLYAQMAAVIGQVAFLWDS